MNKIEKRVCTNKMCIDCVREEYRNVNLNDYSTDYFKMHVDSDCIFIGIIKASICVLIIINTKKMTVSRRQYKIGTDYYTMEQYPLLGEPVKFSDFINGFEYAVIVSNQHLYAGAMEY